MNEKTANTNRDQLFASPLGNIQGFTFDEKVAAVFPDMLQRSIPGYQTIITQTGLLARNYAQPKTRLYDLGCSLGATALSMQNQLETIPCEIIAVDNSEAMLTEAQRLLGSQPSTGPTIDFLHEDIINTSITNASVVALNFTLQFIAPEFRDDFCRRLAAGVNPGGVLVLSEKVVFEEPEINQLHIDMYHAFKRANGYSDLEISQKRTSLENVMVPDTLKQHEVRLLNAGFREVTVWFQCFNFLSIIALK